MKEFRRPYFRDFVNLRRHGGKSFLAPSRIFKAEHSLYFPNIHGQTLEKGVDSDRDTTPVLRGRTSIVAVFSSTWAEGQVQSFLAKKANPDLHAALDEYKSVTGLSAPQIVRLNIETNPIKAWIVRAFFWSLRRMFAKSDWAKYFLITYKLSDEVCEATGILNGAVGYVYLVDESCRIRWAGSGDALEEERQSLVKGLRRLVSSQEV